MNHVLALYSIISHLEKLMNVILHLKDINIIYCFSLLARQRRLISKAKVWRKRKTDT